MPTSIAVDRRAVLRLLGWWLALGGSPLLARAAPAGGLVGGLASAVAIGRLYLRQYPEEGDEATLRGALGLGPGDPSSLSAQEVAATRKRLVSRHRADFEEDRVRSLGGYTLSLTELRLAALLAIADGAGATAPR